MYRYIHINIDILYIYWNLRCSTFNRENPYLLYNYFSIKNDCWLTDEVSPSILPTKS